MKIGKIRNRKAQGNVKAQVAVFVILALVIIMGIIIIFLLLNKPNIISEDIENPQVYIDSCVRESTEQAIEILSKQGGDINPRSSVMYLGTNISYLCYTPNYYEFCTNQRPMLVNHIENEITNYIEPKVEICFNSLKSRLEEKNYEISLGTMGLSTELKTRQVIVDIDKDLTITQRDKSRDFDNFKIKITDPVYDLAEVANEISSQEAKYCKFDYLDYMLLHPQYDIKLEKTTGKDNIKVYTIKELNSQKEFKLAIRGCVSYV